MSITIFPAQIGTFMIERDPAANPPAVIRVPVIGWTHIQGNMAFPICAMNHGGLTHGKAILHPEGFVTDSVNGLTFETEAEWLNFIKTAKAPGDEPEDDRAAAMPDDDEPEEDVESVGPAAIQFGTKTYKTNSFWSMPSENAIFQIEGGKPYPKDERCEKVTRDQYAALKKGGATVIDPTPGEVSEEDDDDAMDLV